MNSSHMCVLLLLWGVLFVGCAAPKDEQFVREYIESLYYDTQLYKELLPASLPRDLQLNRAKETRAIITPDFEINRWDESWATPVQCYVEFSNGAVGELQISYSWWRVHEAWLFATLPPGQLEGDRR